MDVSKSARTDGLLARASKKLVSDEGLLPELGPARLDRELQKYIWNGKDHLSLKDLWDYMNRYTYLPRIKKPRQRPCQNGSSGRQWDCVPGPFAYADRWDDANNNYVGLAISGPTHVQVVIDSDSVIINPEIAETHRPKTIEEPIGPSATDPHGPSAPCAKTRR